MRAYLKLICWLTWRSAAKILRTSSRDLNPQRPKSSPRLSSPPSADELKNLVAPAPAAGSQPGTRRCTACNRRPRHRCRHCVVEHRRVPAPVLLAAAATPDIRPSIAHERRSTNSSPCAWAKLSGRSRSYLCSRPKKWQRSENNVRDVHRLPSEPIRGPAALPAPRRLGADGYPDENAGARRVAPRISFPHLWRPSPPHRYVVCASACCRWAL